MATLAEVKNTYRAINRIDLNDANAQAVVDSIAGGGTTLADYRANLIAQATPTTQAAFALAGFFEGAIPTSARVDSLTTFAVKQFDYYSNVLKSGNAQLGAYEALGRAFSMDATTKAGFAAKYGSLSSTDFVNTVYAQVFSGAFPTAGALANLTAQITYFTNLYTGAGLSAADAALQAKGAVLGQIIGYAFTNPAFAGQSTMDDSVRAALNTIATDAAAGNMNSIYGAGIFGAAIAVVAGDIVSPTAAAPLQSTSFNDVITGVVNATNKIDGGAGNDTANLSYAADTKLGQLVNVETVNLNSTGAAAKFDLDGSQGVLNVGFTNTSAAGEVINIASGVNLSVVNDTGNATTFTFKDTSSKSDVANLTVNNAIGTVTIAGVETINVKATGAASAFKLDVAAATKLAITAEKAVAIDATADVVLETVTATGAGQVTLTALSNTVKTIDASGTTGGVIVANVGTGAATLKGGSGNDTFGGITKDGAIVTAGAGNDTITFTLAAASKATVTGGAGADTITLSAGTETVVYTAGSDSSVNATDILTGFASGTDKIDLKALNLQGDKTGIGAFNALTGIVDGANYFGGKAVSVGTFAAIAGQTFLLADVNGNGVFDINTDLIVNVTGGVPANINDFIFS